MEEKKDEENKKEEISMEMQGIELYQDGVKIESGKKYTFRIKPEQFIFSA